MEYNAVIKFYSRLTTVFHDKSYLFHFVSAGIIPPDNASQINNLPDNERAICILKSISAPLECGEKQNFKKMLKIMQDHGNLYAQQLAKDVNTCVMGQDPVVKSKTIETTTVIEGNQIFLHAWLHSVRL